VLEQPALRRLLPARFESLRVLDLGCGFGDLARDIVASGATEVVAVDISERMISEAQRRTHDPRITYVRSAIEDFDVDAASFDVIVSSLTLHYIQDYASVVRGVASALRPGGTFVFSVEHPICTALDAQEWHRNAKGAPQFWPVDNYRKEGVRSTNWFVDGVIKYHRMVETYVNGLIGAGLRLDRLEEPEPLAEAVKQRPDLALHRRRPPFLLIGARKV
jgi:ubiquinone/menaquinone biosynthesis C-methylase UbiE